MITYNNQIDSVLNEITKINKALKFPTKYHRYNFLKQKYQRLLNSRDHKYSRRIDVKQGV